MTSPRPKQQGPAFGAPDPRRGWQVVFPVGTFPILFHPMLARVLPIALLALTAVPALLGAAWGWSVPLLLWLGLTILLSIPIVQWAAFLWGLHRVQAALPPLAMILIVGLVATGATAPTKLAAPFLFFATHLGLAVAGRARLRAALSANAAVMAETEPSGALPPLRADARDKGAVAVETLLSALALPAGYQRNKKDGWHAIVRVAAADAGEAQAEAKKSAAIQCGQAREGVVVVRLSGCEPPARTLRVRTRRADLITRLALGGLKVTEASIGSNRSGYLSGLAAPLLWYPGFALFLSGYFGGRPTCTAGFVRGPAVRLGEGLGIVDLARLTATALRDPDAAPSPPLMARDTLGALIAEVLDREAEAALASLDATIAAPLAGRSGPTSALARMPDRLTERAPAMIAALETIAAHPPAADIRKPMQTIGGPVAIARAIELLSEDAFRAIAPRLLTVLAEPVMAGGAQMRFGEGGARSLQVSRDARFAGFNLLYFAEGLYPRVAATLGESARPTIERLIAHYGQIPPLKEARRRLDA